MTINPFEPPKEQPDRRLWSVRLLDGRALHRVAVICWVISLALLLRVILEPRFDQQIGLVASLTGLASVVAICLSPRRPWSLGLGVTGFLLMVLPPLCMRA